MRRPEFFAAPCLALLLVALSTVGCTRSEPSQPNLLLIVVDTLRADHLGSYGYPLATSPAIDALAEQGVLFEQAIAPAPWTRPSAATLLTGLLPETLGLTCASHNLPRKGCDVLPAGALTLAERLAAAGYDTAAVVANIQVDSLFGFAQGYDEFASVFPDLTHDMQARADWSSFKWEDTTTRDVTDRALAWLAERGRARSPFFLYLHYLDPHEPYTPPAEHAQLFASADYDSPYPEVRRDLPLYDGEIHYVDSAVGRVLDSLAAAGLEDNTIVLLTSDHGEAFGEHGALDRHHGLTLFDDQLHVPLIVRAPGRLKEGVRVTAQVRLVDVLPSLLELMGLEPSGLLQGHSLLKLARGGADPNLDAVAAWGYRPLKALRTPPWKLIVDHRSGQTSLYNLAADPLEQHDVSRGQAALTLLLRDRMQRRLDESHKLREALATTAGDQAGGGSRDNAPLPLSDRQREGLRALGYLDDGEQ